jgi:hypothetical protein
MCSICDIQDDISTTLIFDSGLMLFHKSLVFLLLVGRESKDITSSKQIDFHSLSCEGEQEEDGGLTWLICSIVWALLLIIRTSDPPNDRSSIIMTRKV